MEEPLHSTTDLIGRSSGFALDDGYAVAYAYDMFGRFHSVSSSVHSVSSVVEYSHLPDTDLLAGMTATSGFLWARAYESRSLITAVENSFGETVISRYDYENNELGRRTHIERSGSAFGGLPVRDAYEYNPRSEVTSARRTPVGSQTELRGFSYDYAYDPIGNRITSTEYDHEGNALESEYTANALNQYGQRTVPGYAGVRGEADTNATVTVNADPAWRWGEYFYGGDEADNSSDAVMKELEITATYSNLFTSVTGRVFVAETPEAFQYDDDGNLTQDGRFDYTWNGENRLITAETRDDLPAAVPRVCVEYAYDHQGRMVWKQISTNAVVLSTRTLLWDGYNIVRETICNQQSAITNSYVWGLDLSGTLQGAGGVGGLLAEVKDGSPYYAAFDANGNVTEYLSEDGTIAAHYEYSPFGEIVVQSGDLADSFTHRFSTKPWCLVTGLSEYEFRKYSPSMGTWVSRDPIGEQGGLGLYRFVKNAQILWIDALGLMGSGNTPLPVIPGDNGGQSGVPTRLEKRDCLWTMYFGHLLSDGAGERLLKWRHGAPACGDRFGIWACADNLFNGQLPPEHLIPGLPGPPSAGPIEEKYVQRFMDLFRKYGIDITEDEIRQSNYRNSAEFRDVILPFQKSALEAAREECKKKDTCCKAIQIRIECSDSAVRAERNVIELHRIFLEDAKQTIDDDLHRRELYGDRYLLPLCNTTYSIPCETTE